MERRRSWRLVAGAAGALTAVAVTLTVCVGAGVSAAPAVPTLPSLPTPPVTAPPLPSLPLPSLPLPSLPLPSLPLPTSLPPVTGLPGPLGSPASGLPSGVAGGPGAATGTHGDSSGPPPFVQASLFNGLLGLLGTPANVGVERPSLQHFDVQAALAADRVSASGRGGADGASPVPAVLAGLFITTLAVMIGMALARQRRRRLSRFRAMIAGPLIALAAVMSIAATEATWFPAKPAATPTTVALANTGLQAPARAADAASRGSALFGRLLGFETRVAAIDSALQAPTAGEGAALLRGERALASSLEAVEQQEYAFYSATAQDAAQAGALLQATATQPAATRSAVSYDVQAVQAQLAQQAAIAQASQTVAQPPSLPVSGVAPAPASAPLSWPMGGVITQRFGPNQVAIEPALTLAGITYAHFHTGIDIASAFGTPVQAAAAGVVALAGSEVDGLGHLVGYGNYVVIAHGANMITLYGHLERLLVHAGQTVHAGDPIGLEGSTGNSTGPHVHFELRVDGVPTDPTGYVRAR